MACPLRSTPAVNEMFGQNTTVLVYAIPTGATHAIRMLQSSRCKVGLSVIARKQNDKTGDEGGREDFWNRLWAALPDGTCFAVPEIGPIFIAGTMVGLMVSVLNNVTMFDGLNALEACLHSIGVLREKIAVYEAAVEASGILLLVHGTVQEIARARKILGDAWTEHCKLVGDPGTSA